MIVVVSSGAGNIGSVLNMIRRIGSDARLSSSPDEVRMASKLILPGVGAFDAGMKALRDAGLDDAICHAVAHNGTRILGICLGMQLLLESSEEGTMAGLGLVPGRARRFCVEGQGIRVPHMGWNVVRPVRPSVLFDVNAEEQRFYFVHSYYVECDDPSDVCGVTNYGQEYTSAFERERVLGVQFHAEKSHRFGLGLLRRFLEV